MTVNALATGLIVFRIFQVFREVKLASDDPTFGATGGNKLRSIIFILIESGITLFLAQFGRLVITPINTSGANTASEFFVGLHQQLNVIIILVFLKFHFTDDVAWLGNNTYNHPGAGVNGIIFPRSTIPGRCCRKFAVRL